MSIRSDWFGYSDRNLSGSSIANFNNGFGATAFPSEVAGKSYTLRIEGQPVSASTASAVDPMMPGRVRVSLRWLFFPVEGNHVSVLDRSFELELRDRSALSFSTHGVVPPVPEFPNGVTQATEFALELRVDSTSAVLGENVSFRGQARVDIAL